MASSRTFLLPLFSFLAACEKYGMGRGNMSLYSIYTKPGKMWQQLPNLIVLALIGSKEKENLISINNQIDTCEMWRGHFRKEKPELAPDG